ncbi:MAG: hypothetical protein GAK29_05028 [Acinetobacter bereziniae]|uniref:Uncharacterized protein n=1 Tax=Acinetobacter bereziniae TaxID=106648 RepID=A0A833P9M9_ACIBZ|nr:MAG: hypothetical protein GAK29_05028 [Acinetobacter bereziniae]
MNIVLENAHNNDFVYCSQFSRKVHNVVVHPLIQLFQTIERLCSILNLKQKTSWLLFVNNFEWFSITDLNKEFHNDELLLACSIAFLVKVDA